jgi:O-antigen/teichoic acid export membrane protein
LSVFWNVVGLVLPMVVAVFAIPLLITGMGKERFGLLAIIWMGVGYFSLFDFGLGRALTKLVSERLGSGDLTKLGPLIWTGLIILAGLGVLGGLLVWALAEPIVGSVLNVQLSLQSEAVTSFRLLAIGIPVVVLTSALIGLLEAYQRFGLIALVRVPLGVLTFAGPLLTIQYSPSLVWATLALLVSRFVACIAYFAAAAWTNKELRRPTLPERSQIRPLVSFGGWQTVTNIVSPLMTYMDRFFVGAVLNLGAVAFYVAPYEAVSRISMLPAALMNVVFPAFSTASAAGGARLSHIYADTCRLIGFAVLPVSAALFLLAPEILRLWLGQEFAAASASVVKWLAIGLLVNTLAKAPFTVLQSIGRPDLVALTHLAELVPYFLVLWFATSSYGIAGTAFAWALRAGIDAAVLNEICGFKAPELRGSVRLTRIALICAVVGFSAVWSLPDVLIRILILVCVCLFSALALLPFVGRIARTFSGSDALNKA